MATAISAVRKHTLRSCLLGLALCPTAALLAQQKGADTWEVLSGCRLATNGIVDGDSFHARHDARDYIFRLYFVDAPESNNTFADRNKDQAAYFGIATNDIPRAGRLAAQFTREALSSADFTVITRWQNAMGRSSLARFYAVVLVNGRNLAEELVAHGLVRISGLKANWPGGPRSATFNNTLKNLELAAREKTRGVWDETQFPRQNESAAPIVATTNAPTAASLVDLNRASYEELQKLPGIGPKLAERIMAHRPYKNVDDLDRVPGIGPAKLQRLAPLIRDENSTP